jgi:hypothetical protein
MAKVLPHPADDRSKPNGRKPEGIPVGGNLQSSSAAISDGIVLSGKR